MTTNFAVSFSAMTSARKTLNQTPRVAVRSTAKSTGFLLGCRPTRMATSTSHWHSSQREEAHTKGMASAQRAADPEPAFEDDSAIPF